MNKTTQKTNRFNIIDFVLIVTVLACIIGVVARTNIKDNVLLNDDTATVTVMVRSLLKDNVKQLVTGDEYFYQNTGNSIGVLQSYGTTPAKIRTPRFDGTIAITEYANRTDVICKVKVNGVSTETGFYVDGSQYIGCGSSILVRSKNLETEWLVVDIEVDPK